MTTWELEEKRLDLKYTWKISRGATDYKINFLVRVNGGGIQAMGECAPNIRYGETPELVREQFLRFLQAGPGKMAAPEDFGAFAGGLELCHSLRFGLESAFVHHWVKLKGVSLYDYLGIQPPGPVKTSYSLPIMEAGEIGDFIRRNDLGRFGSLKVKVNRETAADALKEVETHFDGGLIIDANEAWTDPDLLLKLFELPRKNRILFVEQPFPAALWDEYLYLKPRSPFLLMADESVEDSADMQVVKEGFHGVNMKLMKAGGYFSGLKILNDARRAGLKTMIGCMIETSVGISSALHLCHNIDFADLDGFLVVKDEPFGLVEERNGELSLAD